MSRKKAVVPNFSECVLNLLQNKQLFLHVYSSPSEVDQVSREFAIDYLVCQIVRIENWCNFPADVF